MGRQLLSAFRHALLRWGERHFRPYPWRQTSDPYLILIAEVMLHRTQASQVMPVYEQFIKLYPDSHVLSKASRRDLQKTLLPLGLRWRIDLIHEMAREMVSRSAGRVPKEQSDLNELPGVSHYIASAVRCFAWNFQEVILDTNTVRVVARLLGLRATDSSRRSRLFRTLAEALIDRGNPRAYNYALLDLADKVCTARKPPVCEHCPVRKWCEYAARNRGDLPELATRSYREAFQAEVRQVVHERALPLPPAPRASAG